MKIKSKRLFSTMLSLALVFSLFAAFPLTANADNGNQLKTQIEGFDHGGQGELEVYEVFVNPVNHRTFVHVRGTVTGAVNLLILNINSDVTVMWKASYSGTMQGDNMIHLHGSGTFRVEPGGSIMHNGTGHAIYVSGSNSTIDVNGGTVSAARGNAIYLSCTNASVTVSDGTIVSSSSEAIYVTGENNSITVSGGTVISSIDLIRNAIFIHSASTNTTVDVSGGFVFSSNPDSNAIRMSNGGAPTITAPAVVCAWDIGAGNTAYTIMSSDDLTVAPSGATAVWNKSGSQNGISYANGSNTGFFPISGVTVGQAVTKYNVTVNSNGGNSPAYPVVVNAGDTVAKPADPSRAGYTFGGWYKEEACINAYDFSTPVTANITLYAKWVQGFTVTFNSGGGSAVAAQTVNSGSVATKPADPTRTGFTFGGWFTDSACTNAYNFSTPVTANITLYAKWVQGKTAAVGAQSGTLTQGAAGTVSFPITTANIINGAYPVTVSNLPTGVTVQGQVQINNNSGTLMLSGSTSTVAGVTNTLKLTIDGVESAAFTLTVAATTTTPVTPNSMTNFKKINTYQSGQFPDVNENAWYGFNNQKVVALAFEYGLMAGNSDGTFNQSGYMTVAEALAVASRIHKIYKTGSGEFTQGVPWYQVYVDYSIANDIITADMFAGNYSRPATRAEMAYIFSGALPISEFAAQNTVNALPDVNATTPYSAAIILMYKAGVLGGSDASGTFNPNSNIIRAEAAAIISRVILPAERFTGKTFG